MEASYDLPNGDRVRVIDTSTVGQALGRILQLFRSGETEPVFFGDSPRPEGVVISFEQWAEYETLREDAEDDRKREQMVRERLNSARPEDYVPYEDMLREWGLDEPDAGSDKR
ncbi:hypothetical protein AB0L70_13155 [Kribbella sp. NPDC051952]|uniref:hypothetical protein n=1 Tax=Kribbella sp. NPDC051952 TaxID=3154851 RepID=UPI0034231D12